MNCDRKLFCNTRSSFNSCSGLMKEKNPFYSTASAKSAQLKVQMQHLFRSPNLNITRNYVTTIEFFFNKINVSIDFVFGQFVVLVSL